MHRLDVSELLDVLVPIVPGKEAPAGMKAGVSRVLVVDRDGDEFQKRRMAFSPAGAKIAGTTPERRAMIALAARRIRLAQGQRPDLFNEASSVGRDPVSVEFKYAPVGSSESDNRPGFDRGNHLLADHPPDLVAGRTSSSR
jgi:hypothetical protein